MADPKRQRKNTVPPITRIWAECGSLKRKLEETRATVAKLKDILQVQDNWHSRVSTWIGKPVFVCTGNEEVLKGRLLWTDRYNIGVEVQGKERLYNKGHVSWISLQ